MTVKYKITAKPDINFCVRDTSAAGFRASKRREGTRVESCLHHGVPSPQSRSSQTQPDSSVSHCGIE